MLYEVITHNACQVPGLQLVEGDDLIDPVQELRLEMPPENGHQWRNNFV